jgi:valyl-tRNA synthetase
MNEKLDKTYSPSDYESSIYTRWEESGSFKPGAGREGKKPFTIIMPPPNANGSLHLGHMMYVLQDIMVRYNRMQGRPTLWLPGTDHAAIETQYVYERDVLKPQGKTRFDLGPDELVKQIWEYSTKSRDKFLDQFKSIGFSADWSRLKFTMDPDIVETVYKTFKHMFDDGLVYRANRIVNWCPSCQAAFSDIEVDYKDQDDALYELDYGIIKIATTRPETIFADTAIAVNPNDSRYKSLVGKMATLPLLERPLPIIADDAVLPNFGTGALKITPAHSKEDYEIGLRHNLAEISVIDKDGIMIGVPERFAGLNVDQARTEVIKALDEAKLLVKTTPLRHSVAVHDRCGSVIEPLITEQWYIRVKPLIDPTLEVLKNDDIKIIPNRFKKQTINWLEQEHDWNISRQTWWGIKIPIFYKTSNDPDKSAYICSWDESEAITYYGAGNYRAETDTFDTWFSSSQWPYATLMSTGDFDKGHYPTDVLETGRDIMTKWVTKMIWFSLYNDGQIPFKTVYLHGLLTDSAGKKMSKSKGNGLDPLEMTTKYGTDAVRLALTIGTTPGNDGALSPEKIEGYRNFCNKLWNVARFIHSKLPESYKPNAPVANSPIDSWMLAKINTAIEDVTLAIDEYRFSDAGQAIYSLLWDDFADWYIESAKTSPNADLLVFGLETILKLAHPIAPFVTEAIWSSLSWNSKMLIITQWPQPNKDHIDDGRFDKIKQAITLIRSVSKDNNITSPTIVTTDSLLVDSKTLIQSLAKAKDVLLVEQGSGLYLGDNIEAWIKVDLSQINDRLKRLEAQMKEKRGYLETLEAKLANERFMASAPEAIIKENRDRRDDTLVIISKLDEQITELKAE